MPFLSQRPRRHRLLISGNESALARIRKRRPRQIQGSELEGEFDRRGGIIFLPVKRPNDRSASGADAPIRRAKKNREGISELEIR